VNSRALGEPNRLRVDPQHERLLTCISCLALVCVGPHVQAGEGNASG
jgi:hypothetical protein